MNSRERVKRAIEFKKPDRMPVLHMLLQGSLKEYGQALAEMLAKYPSDFVDLEYNTRQWGQPEQTGEFTCEWHCGWYKANTAYVGQVIKHPLADWENLKTFEFPDPKAEWRFNREKIKQIISDNSKRKFIRAYAGNLFELMQWLRGFDELMLDLADWKGNKNLIDLMDRICAYNLETLGFWAKFPEIDGIWLMDDWGTNQALMINPEVWRGLFKPYYQKMFQAIHAAGKYVEFHTDGNTLEIVNDLVEIGVDILNPQHNVMGNDIVRDKLRGKICIRTDIDCQKILPFGTPEDVRRHVRDVIGTFYHPDGGLILHGEIQVKVPLSNYLAMFEAFQEFGRY